MGGPSSSCGNVLNDPAHSLDDPPSSGYFRPEPPGVRMNPYLTTFSISDLEEFTGVKAHTIRIWERRYGLLAPDRTDTNIRRYGVDELRNLMNVAYLNDHGVKISKVAAMSREERAERVRGIAAGSRGPQAVLNELKVAMLRFDEKAFMHTATLFRRSEGFASLAENVYLPLLESVGVLWQTNSICPANEHFVSCLVRRHIEAETNALPPVEDSTRTHVLFLPEHEIHELGLLYANYLLRSAGHHTVYLGQSVPMNDVHDLVKVLPGRLTFISILTSPPWTVGIDGWLQRLNEKLEDPDVNVWLSGPQIAAAVDQGTSHPRFRLFRSFAELRPLLVGA